MHGDGVVRVTSIPSRTSSTRPKPPAVCLHSVDGPLASFDASCRNTIQLSQACTGMVRGFRGLSMSSSGAYSSPSVDESGIYKTEWSGGPAAKQPAGGGASGSGSGGSSSGTGFQVESDGVRAQAAILAQCGEQVAEVLAKLRATLVAGGEPWGTDDLGQKFGASYTGPANQGFASIAGLGTALANVANELVAQAASYDTVEAKLTDTFGKLTGSLGDSASGSSDSSGASA